MSKKVIWIHPYAGKSYFINNINNTDYCDFNLIVKNAGIETNQKNIIDLFKLTVLYDNRIILCSDPELLSLPCIDTIVILPTDVFLERYTLNNPNYNLEDLICLKHRIDYLIDRHNLKNKVITTNKYFSDIINNLKS